MANSANPANREQEAMPGTVRYYEENPWAPVQVEVPFDPLGKSKYIYLRLNDRSFQLMRGKTVKLPWCVARQLRECLQMEAKNNNSDRDFAG